MKKVLDICLCLNFGQKSENNFRHLRFVEFFDFRLDFQKFACNCVYLCGPKNAFKRISIPPNNFLDN